MEIQRLKQWFLKNKRELPWRQNPTPYQVWISEVMLQQTQVSVVVDYYLRWMQHFPSIEALAKASLEQVIKVWEGLGYYSRARRLHEAAQLLVTQHGGQLPEKEDVLRTISGLGPYTANAILSFAYHQKKAAVDGNVMRVITRYKAIAEDVSKAKTVHLIQEIVQQMLPEAEPWVIMEALIELGALVCKKTPLCTLCPLQLSCRAYQESNAQKYPIKKPKNEVIKLHRIVFVLESEEAFLIRHEKEKNKIMAHLWEFPYIERAEGEEISIPEKIRIYFSIPPLLQQTMPSVIQHFTKYEAHLYPTVWKVIEKPIIHGYEWVNKEKMQEHPFSSGHRRILQQLLI